MTIRIAKVCNLKPNDIFLEEFLSTIKLHKQKTLNKKL